MSTNPPVKPPDQPVKSVIPRPDVELDIDQLRINRALTEADRRNADLLREYVSGGSYSIGGIARALAITADDVEQTVGLDTYTRMMNDAIVRRSVNYIKLATTADDLVIRPAVPMPRKNSTEPGAQAKYEQAKEYADFAERVIAWHLEEDLRTVLCDMLSACVYGCSVGELVYELVPPGTDDDAGRIVLKRWKPKPREATAFVVDPFLNVLGLMYAEPGYDRVQTPSGGTGSFITSPQNVLPREKFAVLTLFPNGSDPRGTSLLRAAYNPWTLKTKTWPYLLRYLSHFAVPTVIGTTAEGEGDKAVLNEAGEQVYLSSGVPKYVTAEEAMRSALEGLANGTVFVGKFGSEVTPLTIPGDTSAVFEMVMGLFNSEITSAILNQTLANSEAKFGTRAQSQTHMQVLDQLIWYLRGLLVDMISRDILRPLMEWNFGPDSLRLMPKLSLGDTERRDFATDGQTASSLGFKMSPSQFIAMDGQLGLPERDEEDIKMMMAAQEAGMQMAADQAKNGPPKPGEGKPPKPGEKPPPKAE